MEGPRYPHSDLTRRIIGGFYDVYNELGAGFREIVYERAMEIALGELGLAVERQASAPVQFRNQLVGRFRPDLIVDGRVLVELKAQPELTSAHRVQVLNALKATHLMVGLLLNFGPKPEVARLIHSH